MKKRIIFILSFIFIFFILEYFIFSPIYKLNSVYISYGLFPYDICQKQPRLWTAIKITFIISNLFNLIIISNIIFSKLLNTKSSKISLSQPPMLNKNNLQLLIGSDSENNSIYIPEKG